VRADSTLCCPCLPAIPLPRTLFIATVSPTHSGTPGITGYVATASPVFDELLLSTAYGVKETGGAGNSIAATGHWLGQADLVASFAIEESFTTMPGVLVLLNVVIFRIGINRQKQR